MSQLDNCKPEPLTCGVLLEKKVHEHEEELVKPEDSLASPRDFSRPASAVSQEINICAICLTDIPFSETAQPDCCEHNYCVCCILHWSTYKDNLWCPQCKLPFTSLLTYCTLDGKLREFPSKESVCLLKRSQWFSEYLKAREEAYAALRPGSTQLLPVGPVVDGSDYLDYGRFYDEYDDDEEIENFYFSAAAGRARILIGNRRHGPNGYLSSGRMQARPVPPAQAKGRGGKASAKGDSLGTPSGRASGQHNSSKIEGSSQKQSQRSNSSHQKPQGAGKGSAVLGGLEDADVACSPGSSTGKTSAGRRARRNQRRAAADAKAGL